MSTYQSISEVYLNRIANRHIIKEDTPFAAGDELAGSPEAQEVYKSKASEPYEYTKPGVGKQIVQKRFFLSLISKLENISVDGTIPFAITVLGDVLKKLEEYPNGTYPGTITDFRQDVIIPAVQKSLSSVGVVGKGGKPHSNAVHVARAILEAAIEAKVIKDLGGSKKASTKSSDKLGANPFGAALKQPEADTPPATDDGDSLA